MKEVTVVGGGTGSHTILKGLKRYTENDISLNAIVNTFDSGGSTGQLRDELGILPPGDLRRCLIALADDDPEEDDQENVMRTLFQYRFENGVAEHSIGNLILAAAEGIWGKGTGIGKLSKILRLKGGAYPVSFDNAMLCARLTDGKVIEGESKIDIAEYERAPINYVYLQPSAQVNPKAAEKLRNADILVVGPGDLYTSVIPNLLVNGVPEAIASSTAKIVYVCNMMTKHGETDRYPTSKFVSTIEHYLGQSVNYVVCNENSLDSESLARYAEEKSYPVVNDLTGDHVFIEQMRQDGRFIRHDRDVLGRLITELS